MDRRKRPLTIAVPGIVRLVYAISGVSMSLTLVSLAHPALANRWMAGVAETSADTGSATAIVKTAEQYIGYPYAAIGDTPSTGFSCIGFVHFVFAQNGVDVPEDLHQAYNSAPHVAQSQLQAGDLVFFQNTVWAGISHVDIYVGDGKMIGADSFQTGVEWDTLSDAYWQQHYLGATRPLATATAASTVPQVTVTPVATSTISASTTSPVTGTALPVSPTATLSPSEQAGALTQSPVVFQVGMAVTVLHVTPVYAYPGDRDTPPANVVRPHIPMTVLQIDGGWAGVSYDAGTQFGWVRQSDLALPNVPTAALVVQGASSMVYSSPSIQASVLMALAAGTRLVLLQTDGLWDQVRVPGGITGWVTSSSVAPVTSGNAGDSRRQTVPPESTPHRMGNHAGDTPSTGTDVVVTADILFVRAAPSRHAPILRRVRAGDRLHVLAVAHGWDFIRQRGGEHGWVSAAWVSPLNADRS